MAAGVATRLRINTAPTGLDMAIEPVLREIAQAGYKPVGFCLRHRQANAAVANISAPNSVLDGSSTAVLLHVKSISPSLFRGWIEAVLEGPVHGYSIVLF
jgi:hypothetical protein